VRRIQSLGNECTEAVFNSFANKKEYMKKHRALFGTRQAQDSFDGAGDDGAWFLLAHGVFIL